MRYTKVVAYITRAGKHDRPELLVFDHRDYPEAGTQVPAGTVDQGESVEDALHREIEEETGLRGCERIAKLAVYDWEHPVSHNTHERHIYHLAAPEGTADQWTWIETSGGLVPEHEGYVFLFRWVPLDGDIALAGEQGDYLHLIL
jgi:8-oxo-dGTP diphosphatase